jgi:shikimate kinase
MERAPGSDERPIMLVGLMGAGKTTVGRRLARRLGLPFVDADDEIEAAAGLGIAEIFERYGEPHFRDGERRVIARLVAGPRRVIAAGGGAFVDPATRALVLDRCFVVWLDAEVELLAERVGRRDHRPLARGKDPLALLRALAEERGPAYAQAHLTIRPGELEQTVDAIAARLG